MEGNSFLNLHQEHRTWLSQLDFWKGELAFLKGLCHKLPPEHQRFNGFDHKFEHLHRWLDNMRLQIDSHENFLKEAWGEFPESLELSNVEDHQHNRDHMNNFSKSIEELKEQVFVLMRKFGHNI